MIRTFDDPILKQVCQPIAPADAHRIIRDMKRGLNQHINGVGLAAPQAGHAVRVVILRWPRNWPDVVLINPEIISRTLHTNTEEEGCLSYPGITCKVERFNGVNVGFYDAKGRYQTRDFSMYFARIVQHEIDHLDGICKVGDAWRANLSVGVPA